MAAELDIPQQYAVRLRDDLGWDELVSIGRALESGSKWMLGDLACRVETSYGAGDLARYAEAIGVEYATLRDYKAVAQAYPAESVVRTTNPWSVYRVLVSHPQRMELVSRGQPLTVAEAREVAASHRKPRAPRPRKRPEEKTSPPPGSSPPGEDGRPPVGPDRAADGTGTPAGQEAAGEPGSQAPADGQAAPDSTAPEITEMPAALPAEELERLREETKRAIAEELRAQFRDLYNALAAERDELAVMAAGLAAEVERLSGRMKRCPVHEVPLEPLCPACLEETA
jgi:hypothetical protein